ncbi:hypothetical protein pEaSNUABM37_00111 [Erwinia phage pEa_SNUABM_37]|nr:hypothetical protein pEaSNUABM37_00111 [Erwinia phage pEa_SNUABM_37]QXO10581.1 hypothetical protein pEaSNUABM48_00111 [Erwinia phage pEa_SNUABM_48]
MAITLNWANKNANVTNFKVYRGTTKSNLVLLTTLSSSATSYTDNTAQNNTLYYYQVNVVLGASDEVPGAITPHTAFTDTGPGPQTLLAGTMEWGYFGQLTPAEFIPDAQYKALSTTGTAYGTAITLWCKFAYKGKILFVADNPCRNQTIAPYTFAKSLYNEGVYLGTGDSSLPHSLLGVGAAAVPQTKRTTAGSYEFIVRAMKANETTLPSANGLYNSATPPNQRESVFSEATLIASGSSAWASTAAYVAQGLMPTKLVGSGALLGVYQNSWHITQHFTSASNYALMMVNNGTATTSVTGMAYGTSIACVFLPVLELVTP